MFYFFLTYIFLKGWPPENRRKKKTEKNKSFMFFEHIFFGGSTGSTGSTGSRGSTGSMGSTGSNQNPTHKRKKSQCASEPLPPLNARLCHDWTTWCKCDWNLHLQQRPMDASRQPNWFPLFDRSHWMAYQMSQALLGLLTTPFPSHGSDFFRPSFISRRSCTQVCNFSQTFGMNCVSRIFPMVPLWSHDKCFWWKILPYEGVPFREGAFSEFSRRLLSIQKAQLQGVHLAYTQFSSSSLVAWAYTWFASVLPSRGAF